MAVTPPLPPGDPIVIAPGRLRWEWSIVHRESGNVYNTGWTSEEASYLAAKDNVPSSCDFVDNPPAMTPEHVARFMAYDFEKKEFFYAKEKLEAQSLTLAEVKALLTQSTRGMYPWEAMPPMKPTRAE